MAVAAAIASAGLVQGCVVEGKASTSDMSERIKAGAMIVDVRTPEEFRSGAYPGAKNIPVQELSGRLSEIPKDKSVVVYCRSGSRSAKATQILKQAGYDVANGGGIRDMPR